ncbi:MAG: dephospho-CoA kinase [Fluviicola sp.]|nr:MAG: dephospho-CoA kinase [Fluviicola sp.]
MKKIGITGGIGSGKSIIGKILSIKGFPVFYSDLEAKQIMLHDNKIVAEIKQTFGNGAYLDKDINRSFLADKIFNQPELKNRINAIVHPAVRQAFEDFAKNHQNTLVFNEAAILFETGGYKNFDSTILVIADEDLRLKRVMDRDNASMKSVKERMKNQWSDKKKADLADFIIENNENSLLVPQVEKIISKLQSN